MGVPGVAQAWVSAGDREVGLRYKEAISPLVWEAASRGELRRGRPGDATAGRGARARQRGGRQLKLGPAVCATWSSACSLLQLVHGRIDPSLRSATTLEALAALAKGGYVARDDAANLDRAYRHLRRLEHRIRLHRLRRTHLMLPDNRPTCGGSDGRWGTGRIPAKAVVADRQAVAREVRRIHERLFYRPLLAAVARLSPDEVGLRRRPRASGCVPSASGTRLAPCATSRR